MDLNSLMNAPSPAFAADELLKETEDLLQFGTWVWKPKPATMSWSDGLYRLLGYTRSSLNDGLGLEEYIEYMPPADGEHFRTQLEVAVRDRAPFSFTHTLVNKEGASLMVQSRGKVREENGEVSVLGITQNVSGQSMLQQEVVQHRKLMDDYEIFLKFGTWEYSVETDRIQWSTGMYNLFGYDASHSRDLVINESTYEKHIDPPDYRKGVILKQDTTSSKNEYFWQYRITTAKGETRWLETYGRIIRNAKGEFVKTVGITRDITRLKSYEHSLESKIRELNRSNAELEEFAYVASHDLQEPLRKITSFSERLSSKFGNVLQDEGQLYIGRMQAATNNMRLLIDNLLDFSRISRTGNPFEKTDLNEVLKKVLGDLEVTIEEKQAEIRQDKLPAIEAQPPQMKQLFTNILSNALKFQKSSTPPLITIHCTTLSRHESEQLSLKTDKHYKIEISDNGIGFEQEYAGRIFQIFQRLHGKAEYPGSGIGLAICKKIVDYHNGMIYANGQLNEGTVITIILPEKQ